MVSGCSREAELQRCRELTLFYERRTFRLKPFCLFSIPSLHKDRKNRDMRTDRWIIRKCHSNCNTTTTVIRVIVVKFKMLFQVYSRWFFFWVNMSVLHGFISIFKSFTGFHLFTVCFTIVQTFSFQTGLIFICDEWQILLNSKGNGFHTLGSVRLWIFSLDLSCLQLLWLLPF